MGDSKHEMENTQRLMAKYWKPRRSIAERLKDNTYLFSESNRYIFPGAEVYKDSNDSKDCNDFSDDDSDDSSIGDDSDNDQPEITEPVNDSNADISPLKSTSNETKYNNGDLVNDNGNSNKNSQSSSSPIID